MRNKFLGDSLDMSKRTLLNLLSQKDIFSLVCPLPAEYAFDFELYRSVLQLNGKASLFNPDGLVFRGHLRKRYIEELKVSVSSSDLSSFQVVLLDPDKGMHEFKKTNVYIAISEVKSLIKESRKKTVAIYHHKNAGGMNYLTVLEKFSSFNSFAYDFGAAAICFFQEEAQPITLIKDFLRSELNSKKVLEYAFNQALAADS